MCKVKKIDAVNVKRMKRLLFTYVANVPDGNRYLGGYIIKSGDIAKYLMTTLMNLIKATALLRNEVKWEIAQFQNICLFLFTISYPSPLL